MLVGILAKQINRHSLIVRKQTGEGGLTAWRRRQITDVAPYAQIWLTSCSPGTWAASSLVRWPRRGISCDIMTTSRSHLHHMWRCHVSADPRVQSVALIARFFILLIVTLVLSWWMICMQSHGDYSCCCTKTGTSAHIIDPRVDTSPS